MLNLHTHHPPFRSSSQLLSADVSLGDLDKVPQTSSAYHNDNEILGKSSEIHGNS